MRYFLIIGLVGLVGFITQQDRQKQKYTFGNFSVETDTCHNGASIKINASDKIIYKKCFSDVFRFENIDTLNINSDKKTDFVYCYQMEEYAVVGILVSDKDKVYKNIDVVYVFDPETYNNISLSKDEVLKEYILKDIDGDKRNDIITNVIIKEGKIRAVKEQSDTITYKQIQRLLKQKTVKPISRGIFLDSHNAKPHK